MAEQATLESMRKNVNELEEQVERKLLYDVGKYLDNDAKTLASAEIKKFLEDKIDQQVFKYTVLVNPNSVFAIVEGVKNRLVFSSNLLVYPHENSVLIIPNKNKNVVLSHNL